jgi:hypothetical protein
MKKLLFSFVLLTLSVVGARAQSTCPYIINGAVLTAGQWNSCFTAKQNSLGYVPLNAAGGVMSGPLITTPSIASAAGVNLPPGTAPSSPNNGDTWTTSAGLYVQINGTTIGPLGGATSASFAAISPLAVTFPSGVTTYALNNPFTLANVVSPSTPVLGSTALYVDSTQKVFSAKNDAGMVSITVVPSTGGSNQFATGLNAAGSLTYTVVPFSGLSGTIAAGQFATGPGIVTLPMLNNANASTLVGNVTTGSAARTDFTIDGLTLKASPASTDEVIIWDIAGTAIKKTTVAGIGTSSGVSSFGTLTGAITAGNGVSCVTATCAVSLSEFTNALGSNVALNNNNNYFTGPTVAQGGTGTWYASGTVTVYDASTATAQYFCKLWDGTTVISIGTGQQSTTGIGVSISLSGYLASPASNITISCREINATTGNILSTLDSNAKASVLSAFRIN